MFGSKSVVYAEHTSAGKARERSGYRAMSPGAARYISAPVYVQDRAGKGIARLDPLTAYSIVVDSPYSESNTSRRGPDARRSEYSARAARELECVSPALAPNERAYVFVCESQLPGPGHRQCDFILVE